MCTCTCVCGCVCAFGWCSQQLKQLLDEANSRISRLRESARAAQTSQRQAETATKAAKAALAAQAKGHADALKRAQQEHNAKLNLLHASHTKEASDKEAAHTAELEGAHAKFVAAEARASVREQELQTQLSTMDRQNQGLQVCVLCFTTRGLCGVRCSQYSTPACWLVARRTRLLNLRSSWLTCAKKCPTCSNTTRRPRASFLLLNRYRLGDNTPHPVSAVTQWCMCVHALGGCSAFVKGRG